jgi:hypothetical protein
MKRGGGVSMDNSKDVVGPGEPGPDEEPQEFVPIAVPNGPRGPSRGEPPGWASPSQSDLDDLGSLLGFLERFFDDLIDNPRPAIPGRHHDAVKSAWEELKSLFPELVKEVVNAQRLQRDGELATVGLGGEQIRLKLAIAKQNRDELLDIGLASVGDRKDSVWWSRWIPAAKSFLKSAGVVVGSLAKAIPWVEPLKEFIGAVSSLLDIAERVLSDK